MPGLSAALFRRLFAQSSSLQVEKICSQTEGGSRLVFTYEEILSRLRQDDAADGTKAAMLLEFVAFMAPDAIPAELLRSAMAGASPSVEASLAPLEFESARKELLRLHLVQVCEGGL